MKPVTELYEAAGEAAGTLTSEAADDLSRHAMGNALLKRIGALDRAAGGAGAPDLLAVLDLVATLPPERLGLVRWVAGLSLGQIRQIRNVMEAALEEGGDEDNSPEEHRLREALEKLDAALSGGEGGAKEERHAVNEQGDCAPWCRACLANTLARLYPDGTVKVAPAPTILPAGKPPPFLRVGMVLESPATGGRFTAMQLHANDDVRLVGDEGTIDTGISTLEDWPLAEPFTVEGE